MPVDIGEISSTVHVDDSRGASAEGSSSPTTPPTPQDQQRWQALAQRSQQLLARTAAWGFDD